MNLAEWVQRGARNHGERPAISRGVTVELTYRQWAMRTRILAGNLARLCRPNERVAIVMTNRTAFYEALFAIWHAGLVAVPCNAKLHADELRFVVEDSESSLTLVSPDCAANVTGRVIASESADWRQLGEGNGIDPVTRDPDDLAWLFYTSGTTGAPKGAMLTHRNLMAQSLAYYADIESVDPSDAILHLAPMSHGSGLYGLPFVAKAANNIIPESDSLEPEEVAALLRYHKDVSFFAAPTIVTRLVNHSGFAAADHDGLRTIVYGGGPMHLENLISAMDLLGPRFAQIYGQGEAPMTITALAKALHADRLRSRWREIMNSVGVPRTNVQVRVVDAGDRDVPLGETGEVLCSGDVVMRGYWLNSVASAETLRGGWLHTGDLGSFDEEGFLTLRDRAKDVIISGGSNIYPREVEEVLLRHPAVLEVSVIGRRDRYWGEEVVACVVPQPDHTVNEHELDTICLNAIARFKRPRHYVFLDALPKNNYGKVLKTVLRSSYG
jgi:acyl-CoA synthetase (AMP-forming)/AMP-acid ligase II